MSDARSRIRICELSKEMAILRTASCRAPPRRQVRPSDQGDPWPDRQQGSRRRSPGRTAARVDPPAQRQGRPAHQGSRPAPAGPGLRGDRAALACLEELGLLWVRDLPEAGRELSSGGVRQAQRPNGCARYWTAERRVLAERRAAASAAAAAEIGSLTDRELLIAGAIAYWCEGTKNKPHRRADRVTFIEQRPSTHFVLPALLGRRRTSRARIWPSNVQIHETADVAVGRTVLAGPDRGTTRPVPQDVREAPQPRDDTEEHLGRLPRVPADRRQAKLRALPKDRGMGLRGDGSRGGAGLGRSLRTAPGEGFEPPSDGTKTRCLAWLDHPGKFESSLYLDPAGEHGPSTANAGPDGCRSARDGQSVLA